MAETLVQYALLVGDLKRRGVVELFAAQNPLMEQLYFIDLGDAMGYEYNVEASLGGVGFRSLNGQYDAAAQTSGTVNPIKEGTAILGGPAKTDVQLVTTRATRIAQKVKAASRFFTRNFFRGNTSVDARGFDGLNRRLQNANRVYAGANGGVLDLDVLEKLIARIPGEAGQKRLCMGYEMQLRLGSRCRAAGATVMGYVEWQGQITPKSYAGVPIIPVGEDENRNEILGFDETRGTSTVTGSIYGVRLGKGEDGEFLQGIAQRAAAGIFTTRDEGVRDSMQQDMIEGRAGIVIHHDRSAFRYAGIVDANA